MRAGCLAKTIEENLAACTASLVKASVVDIKSDKMVRADKAACRSWHEEKQLNIYLITMFTLLTLLQIL
jgi:hypothetical protein